MVGPHGWTPWLDPMVGPHGWTPWLDPCLSHRRGPSLDACLSPCLGASLRQCLAHVGPSLGPPLGHAETVSKTGLEDGVSKTNPGVAPGMGSLMLGSARKCACPDCRENATLRCASVVVARHKGTERVQKGQILKGFWAVHARVRAAFSGAWRGFAAAAGPVRPADTGSLDPLFDDHAALLPGTGSGAFWTGLLIVSLSLISGLATYLILTGLTPIVPRNEVVLGVLFINLLLVVAMVVVIAVQMAGLWRAWKKRVAGARLHARIVALFSVIAALPALLLAVGATTTFSRSLDNWFNRQTTSIVMSSLDVAHAYLEEHGQVIRTDIVNMAKDLDDAAPQLAGHPRKFRELVFAQAGLRDLPVAYVVDARGAVKVAALEDERIPYIPPPEHLLRAAEAGQVPLLMPINSFRVAAIVKLHNYPD